MERACVFLLTHTHTHAHTHISCSALSAKFNLQMVFISCLHFWASGSIRAQQFIE